MNTASLRTALGAVVLLALLSVAMACPSAKVRTYARATALWEVHVFVRYFWVFFSVSVYTVPPRSATRNPRTMTRSAGAPCST
jgi:hypothetical protein